MNFQPKSKDHLIVTWDIIYQTSKEVMTSIINKNSDITSLSEKLNN